MAAVAPPASGGVSAGRVVGFIRPPPDVRGIVDKTAQFVAKAGPDFEGKIAEREAGNLKFAFLRPDNPYHAYYRHKVEEIASGKAAPAPAAAASAPSDESQGDGSTAAPPAAAAADAAPALPASSAAPSVRRAAVANPLMAALKSARDLLAAGTQPPKDEFTIPTPSYGVGELVDTIKLTAQFTAVNGRGFLASLTAREMRNPLFDFLKPTHALFAYFTALVNAYVRVLQRPPAVIERVHAQAADRWAALGRVVHRLEARRVDAARREAAAADGTAFAAVDWHDFVVVETITFDDEEDDELPAPHPAPRGALAIAAAVRRRPQPAAPPSDASAGGGGAPGGADDDMDTSDAPPPAALPPPPPPPPDHSAAPFRVVLDYTPSLPTALPGAAGVSSFVDPRTGAVIPAGAVAEHVRAESLDPKWAVERAKFLSRHTDSLFAPGDTISDNLKRLAGARSDIFGSASEQEARAAAAVPAAAASEAADDDMDTGGDDDGSGRATKRVRTL